MGGQALHEGNSAEMRTASALGAEWMYLIAPLLGCAVVVALMWTIHGRPNGSEEEKSGR